MSENRDELAQPRRHRRRPWLPNLAEQVGPRIEWPWRRRKHRHAWTYSPRSIGGWGIARCTSCGQEDLY